MNRFCFRFSYTVFQLKLTHFYAKETFLNFPLSFSCNILISVLFELTKNVVINKNNTTPYTLLINIKC